MERDIISWVLPLTARRRVSAHSWNLQPLGTEVSLPRIETHEKEPYSGHSGFHFYSLWNYWLPGKCCHTLAGKLGFSSSEPLRLLRGLHVTIQLLLLYSSCWHWLKSTKSWAPSPLAVLAFYRFRCVVQLRGKNERNCYCYHEIPMCGGENASKTTLDKCTVVPCVAPCPTPRHEQMSAHPRKGTINRPRKWLYPRLAC